jgi:SRR1
MSRTKSVSPKSSAKPKFSRELQQLQNLYDDSKALYYQSLLSKSIALMLRAKQGAPLTKAISLGLGSLTSRDQSRRIKQLTIFLAITEQLESSMQNPIKLYAQDPTFTKTDEAFLQSLGITILRTPSPSALGEAEKFIDRNTLVYSPFLTIEAYQSILESCTIGMLVGDDFNALRLKWPKHTTEHDTVEKLVKRDLTRYERRSISRSSKDQNDFWENEDKPFPMAVYSTLQGHAQNRRRNNQQFPAESGFNHLEKTISARL